VSLPPRRADLHVILDAVSQVVRWFGIAASAIGLLTLPLGDVDASASLLLAGSLGLLAGTLGRSRWRSGRGATWGQAMSAVAASWLACAVLGGVPLLLSGHWDGWLDATFEAMSGLTSTGLSVGHDLDHLPAALHLWRTALHGLGAFSVVTVVLTLQTRGDAQIATSNVPETHDDRTIPNVTQTARDVARVAAAWLLAGTAALTLALLCAGLPPARAVGHALLLGTSALTTGGFAPSSQSAGAYHAPAVDLVLVVLMLAGALSVAVHRALWARDRAELRLHIESRTFVLTFGSLLLVSLAGLGRSGAFTDALPMLRQGGFTLVAAHTTTAFHTGSSRLIATDWGLMAPAALVAAMTIGGMAASGAGGVKLLRVGLLAKGVVREIRRVLLPSSALVVQTYHQRRRHVLVDQHVRAAATILLLMLFSALSGALLLLATGATTDLTEALFESTSALTNTGLSVGVLTPDASAGTTLVLLVLMWLGRLEFLAVFAMLGYLVTVIRRPTT
jgi:trk system potassium uptake protein